MKKLHQIMLTSGVTLANIEAMARDTENDQHATVDCYGIGELRCPIGGVCATYVVTETATKLPLHV